MEMTHFFKAMTITTHPADSFEVEGFYVENISIFKHSIVSKKTNVIYEIDIETLRKSTPVEDVHGDTVYEGDYIEFGENLYKVVSYCDFIAYRGMKSTLMPSLICETEDGTHDQLVKKSSGDDWMKLNAIETYAIVIVGTKYPDDSEV